MILTVLQAHVAPERVEALKSEYRSLAARPRPSGLVRSHLIRSTDEPPIWRVETLWQDRQSLDAMRGQGTPAGVLLFRTAGAEPTLSIFEVVADLGSDEP